MTVPFRILSLLLCLFVAGPVSTPAWARARPETRVGGSSVFSSASTSADLDQTAGLRGGNRGCGYDFASGVCKYLYAHGNPVMNIDPSGNITMTEVLTVTFNVTKQFGARAFAAYQVYDKADSVRNLAQLVSSLATGGSVSGLQIALTAVDFLPFGKLLKKMEKAGEVTKEGLDVLAGVFRQTRKSEAIGELGALMAARARGFKSVGFHPRYHGFDDIVEDAAGNLIIVEAKGGSSALRQTLHGQQASRQWIQDKIRILEGGDAQERLLANRLKSQGDNLKVMVATTKADAAGAVTQDVVIKNWNEIGEFTFRLE